MNLETLTSAEVGAYLKHSDGVIVPTGSLEQHGPIGLLGTDAICASSIANQAGDLADSIVAPELIYAPTQFNMEFPGTISVSARVFADYVEHIVLSLHRQGFNTIYFLNGHGANLAPLQCVLHDVYAKLDAKAPRIRIKSWWEFDKINQLRNELFGEREGMHATPSEISITQHTTRKIEANKSIEFRPLDPLRTKEIAGDKHAPASIHKNEYPDGQVGADSSLAKPEHGEQLLQVAAQAVAKDYTSFLSNH